MSAQFTYFVQLSLVIIFFSDAYPIDMQHPVEASECVPNEGIEPVNAVPEEFDGQDVNLLKGEGDEEAVEGGQDLQELSPNTADTMRKINPFTIADQVSQMFHRGNQKANLANKSGSPESGFGSAERDTRGEESHGDQSLAMSTGPEAEDSLIQPGYLRQGVPKIVNKPRSNDYGYSVIVLAGDAVHLPIKVQGKAVRGQGRGAPEDKDDPVDFQKQGDGEERIGSEERTPKKEVRVYKQYSKNPDFPVYDEDFNFVPDPFQGILDENYRIEMGQENKKPVARPDNFRINAPDHRTGLHRIHIRSGKDERSGKKTDQKGGCGSWGKENSTQSEVVAPLTGDSNEN